MLLSDIDLRLLRVFKAVADSGGFVKAQGELGINQPAISSHIANLEQRIGAKLCERGRGGFSLTQAGTEVLEEANTLLGQVRDFSSRLNTIGKKANLSARIGVVDGILSDPGNSLVACIRDTRQKFSDFRVRVGVYDHLQCLDELRSRRLDICIVGVEGPDDLPTDMDRQFVFGESASFYCAPDHDCARSNDKDLCFERLKAARISAHSFSHNPVGKQLNVILQDENAELALSNTESTAYLALCGSHVGLLPDHIAAPWVKDGQLMPILQDRFQVTSAFHALRLKVSKQNEALKFLWASFSDQRLFES